MPNYFALHDANPASLAYVFCSHTHTSLYHTPPLDSGTGITTTRRAIAERSGQKRALGDNSQVDVSCVSSIPNRV